MIPAITNNLDYFVEIKLGANSWFWSLIYRDTVYATGRKPYTTKSSAKRAFEKMFGVLLVVKHCYGKGEYRITYNIFGRNHKEN